MKNPQDYLALALDNISSANQIEALVEQTKNSIGTYKVGLEQFTRFGAPVLDIIRKHNRKIFLDLKFHDIPNTVYQAVKAACSLEVDFLTLHCSGGSEMLKYARKASDEVRAQKKKAPALIGVTLLTSIGPEILKNELAIPEGPSEYVKRMTAAAITASLDGIVCSAADLATVKKSVPEHFEIITPGIRPLGTDAGDQKRIATPEDAIRSGATLLVLGRAVTEMKDPGKAAEKICGSIDKLL